MSFPECVPSVGTMQLGFERVIEPLREEHQAVAADVLGDWLVEADMETCWWLFGRLADRWLLLDWSQRGWLICDALAGLWADVPLAHLKYEQLLGLSE